MDVVNGVVHLRFILDANLFLFHFDGFFTLKKKIDSDEKLRDEHYSNRIFAGSDLLWDCII